MCMVYVWEYMCLMCTCDIRMCASFSVCLYEGRWGGVVCTCDIRMCASFSVCLYEGRWGGVVVSDRQAGRCLSLLADLWRVAPFCLAGQSHAQREGMCRCLLKVGGVPHISEHQSEGIYTYTHVHINIYTFQYLVS